MRNAFADEITRLGADDPRVVLLSGDIGNRLFDKFKAAAPGRFLNCGIAEANMMGMAAGLALNGLRPVVYTIAPFTTVRCLEQIRVDVCYHRLPVVIVGTGGGLAYGELGPTHQSCEDVALLRALPDMVVVCPADSVELRLALRAALAQDRPVYMRIGKKGEPVVHDTPPAFALGRAITLRPGREICLIGTGTMAEPLLRAADLLGGARVESFHTVKPLDIERLEEIFSSYATVVIAEEHSCVGGLAGAVAEWALTRRGPMPRVIPVSAPDEFPHVVGSQEYLRETFGLTAENIVALVRG